MTSAEPNEFSAVLADEELRALSQHGMVKTVPQNVIVVSEGDQTDSLYIILSGKVKVFVADANGKEVVLAVQGAGEYFGEMVLDGGTRSASVMTLERSRFVIVPKSEVLSHKLTKPHTLA
jgi:CRP/FNR family transcriptional regulator, cyclic AMP receptor protein